MAQKEDHKHFIYYIFARYNCYLYPNGYTYSKYIPTIYTYTNKAIMFILPTSKMIQGDLY